MLLRSKVLLSVVGTFGCYLVANCVVQQKVVLPNFVDMERDEAKDDLLRAREAIARELQHLSISCQDWAAWDDMHAYVVGRDEQWARGNLADANLQNAGLDLMVICDAQDRLVFQKALNPGAEQDLSPQASRTGLWIDRPVLLKHDSPDHAINTILLSAAGPLMLVSRPVVRTDHSGPIAGTLIFGRLLDEKVLSHLRDQTRVSFRVLPLFAGQPDGRVGQILRRLHGPEDVYIQERDAETLDLHALLPDHTGRPVLLVSAEVSRRISAQGRAAVTFATASLGLAGVTTALLLLILLGVIVGRPLARLTAHATRIGASGDLTQKLAMTGRDEFGVLGRQFDHMVDALAESRKQLTEASRLAGMAEVAGGILHNVGNVLNNLNTSTGLITEHVRNSKGPGLSRLADLLRAHEAQLAEFMTSDSRGRHVPEYLARLAEALTAEQHQILGELASLQSAVTHVNEIIRAQGRFARVCDYEEPTSLREVVDSSLSMMEPAFARHRIRVERRIDEVPTVLTDRSRLLQILVNLLTNAKDAVVANETGERLIVMTLRRDEDREAIFEVTDSGVGIASENLGRLFENGFTTKRGGSGYGLHYSALSARQLGGSLEVHTLGPGQGATFTLRLPLSTSGVQAMA